MQELHLFVKDIEINGEAGDLDVYYSVVWETESYDAYAAFGNVEEIFPGKRLAEVKIHSAVHCTDYGPEVPIKDLAALYDHDELINELEDYAMELEVMK